MPAIVVVSVYLRVNTAVTVLSESIVTVQEPVPEHAPDQPVKMAPDAGVAVRLTVTPLVTAAIQVEPQLIPAGDEVTVQLPLLGLDMLTLNVYVPAGVMTGVWLDGLLSPLLFTAVTTQEYCVPLIRSV